MSKQILMELNDFIDSDLLIAHLKSSNFSFAFKSITCSYDLKEKYEKIYKINSFVDEKVEFFKNFISKRNEKSETYVLTTTYNNALGSLVAYETLKGML